MILDFAMKTKHLDLYTDYLISNAMGYATATGLSAMVDGAVSHDQVTRFLSKREYDSKDLWLEVKSVVRQIEQDDGCLIFDDTIQEKQWTDENAVMCWHYDHCKNRTVRGINLLNALYYASDVSIPVAFEVIRKPIEFSDIKTRRRKRASTVSKNELLRQMLATCVQNQLKFRDDKKQGRYTKVSELELSENQAVRGWLKGFDREVLLVRTVFTNKDGSTAVVNLLCSDLSCDGDKIATLYQKGYVTVRY
jgi:hypothetical protein